jgi:23S rRNA (pseudouridine1915-N3)-methyltransferase
MKFRVLWPGKTKKRYYKEAIDDYATRIGKFFPFEIVETAEDTRTDRQKATRIRKESQSLNSRRRSPLTVVLDSGGKAMSSEEFASWLEKQQTDIDFLLGGPAGLQAPGNTLRLSFGPMTLPHELARVVLLEQIYRALTIIHHIPYHK